ncbi:MAG: transketolase, partial [Kistimonas sp.]|nr:transketolase [Kistimonas sp.]
LICQAGEQLRARGHRVRVISMPCTEVFDAQDEAYRNSVLPPHIRRRLIVEAAVTDFWYKYAGLDGKVLGMTSFGASAPASDLFKSFGFTVERVLALAEDMLNTGS